MNTIHCIPSLIIAAALSAAAASCSHGSADKQQSAAPDSSEIQIPEADSAMNDIGAISQAIASGNASRFAQKCSYPIERPYPLHSIRDSAEMVSYFPVIADDSLKRVVSQAKTSEWQSLGWRGWTLHNGEYIWYDGDVYAITYLSPAENRMLDSLRRDEINSLDPSLRGGWTPVTVLVSETDSTVYRIDRDSVASPDADSLSVRLAVYPPRSNRHKRPHRLLRGHSHAEGTAGARSYTFRDKRGTRASFIDAQSSPDDTPTIIIVTAAGDSTATPVTPAYWRDLPE